MRCVPVLEKEVKYELRGEAEVQRVRSRLEALSKNSRQAAFEVTRWYETESPGLIRRIRLRQSRENTLTYKEMAEEGDGTKTRFEHTVQVDDLERTRQILEKLGFREAVLYERLRENYECFGAVASIDSMPFGTFLEVEGSLDRIEKLEAELGLNPTERILISYVELGMKAAEKRNCDPSLVTFQAFGQSRPRQAEPFL